MKTNQMNAIRCIRHTIYFFYTIFLSTFLFSYSLHADGKETPDNKENIIQFKQKKKGHISFKYKGKEYVSKYDTISIMKQRIVDSDANLIYQQLKQNPNLITVMDTKGNVEFFDSYEEAISNLGETTTKEYSILENEYKPMAITSPPEETKNSYAVIFADVDFYKDIKFWGGVWVKLQNSVSKYRNLDKWKDEIRVLPSDFDSKIKSFKIIKNMGDSRLPRNLYITLWDGQNLTGNGLILQFINEYGTWDVKDIANEIWPLNEWNNRIRSMEMQSKYVMKKSLSILGGDEILRGGRRDYYILSDNLDYGPCEWSVEGNNVQIMSSERNYIHIMGKPRGSIGPATIRCTILQSEGPVTISKTINVVQFADIAFDVSLKNNNELDISKDAEIESLTKSRQLPYEIFDSLTGSLKQAGTVYSEGGSIKLNNISKGVYILNLRVGDDEYQTEKFVVQ